ncbi:hypothetical protein [Pantanalinema sp. GBBB05]|uniref:hypothetical protein n=1 Tax=Pantanalinema sp. GBBB05 TaxID=2604139 RepID=UPI003D81AC4F
MSLLLEIPQFGKLLQNDTRRNRSTTQVNRAIAGKFHHATNFSRSLVQQGRPAHPRSYLP